MSPNTDGWSKAEMYVTKELDRLNKAVIEISEDVSEIKADVKALSLGDRRHAMIFGLLGGAVMSFIGGIVLAAVLR